MAPGGQKQAGKAVLTQRDPMTNAQRTMILPDVMAREAQSATDFLKALGHDGRLMILCHLCEGERTVTELERLLASRQAAVSQQLARLRHEGLVSTRRDGNQIIYTLADRRVAVAVELLLELFCKP
jgi:DNA-binding transcriptional ArsR family regulator